MLNKCKHDFKPHKFIKCINVDCGNVYYLYELQCMKCGKIPMFKRKKSRKKLELYDFKMEQLELQRKQREKQYNDSLN